ncbi:ATP-binding protein [Kribbella italica]|uniref:Putative kinase n=1 Tax=Kribbella italica TaxID=1540520 RepID=A0A7W9J7Q6_9ACTN|nr:ATP-binding protein [Kribbella italica]MBB5837176.1 putative kinase [Kribbella italica]
MSPRLVVLCGTSYSGKSSFATALADHLDAHVVSLDEINERRGLWGGDGIPVEEWQTTHAVATAEVRERLAAAPGPARSTPAPDHGSARPPQTEPQPTVILDDTSSPRFLRDGWRALAAELGAEFHLIHLDVDHATIHQRRTANQADPHRRHVTDAVLAQHLDDFEPPTPDENPIRVHPGDPLPHL